MILIHLWRTEEWKQRAWYSYRMHEAYENVTCKITTIIFLGLGVTIEYGERNPTMYHYGKWSTLKDD